VSTSQVDVGTNGAAAQAPTFDSLNPSTGDVVASHPIHSAADVEAAVDRARIAAEWWSGLGFAGRAERMRRWAGVLTRRMAQLADVVYTETGKPHSDGQLEIVLAI
jgi:acyl-CoA reductase-like NAD-dependent aldehyde dehydrogenase